MTPPAKIADLSVKAAAQGFLLRWTAPGDDLSQGQAVQYEIRYAPDNLESQWNAAFLVQTAPRPSLAGRIDSVRVSGIGTGPWEFGIRAKDDAGHWSGISNIVSASIDTLPPATIGNLEVRSTVRGYYLRWTAPGDDGATGRAARYDIRYASAELASGWESASIVPSPPAPGPAGVTDSTSVLGIGLGPWEFGIRTADEADNWSALSNIVRTTIPEDDIPPGPVSDLAVDLTTEASVVLRWTVSGDDGAMGRASAYDLRYALSPISSDSWPSATLVSGLGAPRESGAEEMFAVPGLDPGTTYYFALSVLDEVENASDISNQATASIFPPTQLTFFTEYDAYSPDWSPDGQSIVFTQLWESQPGIHTPALYVIPAIGGSPIQYTTNPDGSASAAWSPDGTKFAFSLYVDESTRTILALMDAEPGAGSQILVDPQLPWKSTGGARWSPDGTRIAYGTSTFNPGVPPVSKLFTVASAGGTPELLAGDGTWAFGGLDWSPDGTHILYSSNETGAYQIWTIPAIGGTATQLTTGAGGLRNPSWSPDGRRIGYIHNKQVWVMDASGVNATQVTFNSERSVLGAPAWSPDGTSIAYGATVGLVGNLWVLRIR